LSLYDVVKEADLRERSEERAPRAIQLRKELGDQFLRGELIAYGKKRGDDEPRAISKTAWDVIDLFDRPCNRFDPEDIGRENEITPRYFDVYVIPKDVLSIWPPIGSEPGGTQTRAAEALRIRQAEIDAGRQPTMSTDVALRIGDAEAAAMRADIERLKKRGRKGGEESGKSRRDDAVFRRAHAEGLIIAAVKANPGLSAGEIVREVVGKTPQEERVGEEKNWKPFGLKPYKASMIYQVIKDLVKAEKISPRPDSRK
jgi:hypothetical protein